MSIATSSSEHLLGGRYAHAAGLQGSSRLEDRLRKLRDSRKLRCNLDVLAEAGFLIDDREPTIVSSFKSKTEVLEQAMPDEPSQRYWVDCGLRSAFFILKARKLTFANPLEYLPTASVRRVRVLSESVHDA